MPSAADAPVQAEDPIVFLRDELSRLDGDRPAAMAQTHISVVLLGETLAWKLKKAVKLPYLDSMSPERRLALCERELELNRRTAPALYKAVRKLVRRGDGSLGLDAEGELVEPILEMRLFDEAGVLDGVARRGELTAGIVTRLAESSRAFTNRRRRRRTSRAAVQVYAQLHERAAALSAGHSVVVDAVFDRQPERERMQAVAAASAADLTGRIDRAGMNWSTLERTSAEKESPCQPISPSTRTT